ncbi:WXG100 family type VII secretion target [Nocardia arthritidis]|uniref:WXG100 family type VII secretion target n=1 Tax=Nocardia arthritidis TaxID=228602 RepID=A0A6G9Y6X6_9NOCA|nr:WXG100 family type VII secretion target [Nocardia arthritidis]QIS08826.1 WXG100 family type VII secretion target [Nocardia arthritidis]
MSGADARGYRVDLDHLDQVTTKIGGLLGFLDECLAGIVSRVAALHQEWRGAAATKHAQAHKDWAAGAAEVREGVEAMRAAAANAHTQYTEVAQLNLRMFGGGR